MFCCLRSAGQGNFSHCIHIERARRTFRLKAEQPTTVLRCEQREGAKKGLFFQGSPPRGDLIATKGGGLNGSSQNFGRFFRRTIQKPGFS